MQKQAELYRGKAKTVYSTENPDLLVLEFRNDTSAGDGARIEQFDRKGMVNNKFNHFIMSKLAEAGIPTHMEALLSDTECLVKKLDMVPVDLWGSASRLNSSLYKKLAAHFGLDWEKTSRFIRPGKDTEYEDYALAFREFHHVVIHVIFGQGIKSR